MGINIGEVEAVLSARDNMSPKLVEAAQRVVDLRARLAELTQQFNAFSESQSKNTDAYRNLSTEFSTVNRELQVAETQFQSAGAAQERAAAAANKLAAENDRLALSQAGATTASAGQTAALNANTTAEESSAAAAGTSAARLAELERMTELATQAARANAAAATTQAAAQNLAATAQQGGAAAAAGFGNAVAASEASVKAATDRVYSLASALFNAQASTKTTGAEISKLKGELNDATSNLGAMTSASTAAATRASAMGTAAAMGATGVKQAGVEAKETTEQMNQMERMATRLIERMIILYALKATAGFLYDLFKAAEAMVQLSDTSGLTIAKIQELAYAGDRLGIPFEKVQTALTNLDKNLGSTKAAAGDALLDIGLSFSKVFALAPDQRFDAIVAALAAVPDPLRRIKDAAALGLEGIEPLIGKFEELRQAAHDNNAVLGDDTVHAMANTLELWRNFLAGLKPIAENIIDQAQRVTAALAAPFIQKWDQLVRGDKHETATDSSWATWAAGFMMNPFGTTLAGAKSLYDYTTRPDEARAGGGSFTANYRPEEFVGPMSGGPAAPAAKGGPPTGPDYIPYLKEQLASLRDLEPYQKAGLEFLREHGMLSIQYATNLNVSTEQLKLYTDAMKDSDKAETSAAKSKAAFARIMADADAEIAASKGKDKDTGTLADRLAAIDMEVYKKQVAAQQAIGYTAYEWEAEYKIWEAGEAKKTTLIDNETKKQNDKVEKATNDSIARTTRLWDQYEADTARADGDSWAAKIEAVDVWYDRHRAVLEKTKELNANYENESLALEEAAEAKRARIREMRAEAEQRSLDKLAVEEDQFNQAREVQFGTSMDIQLAGVQRWLDQELSKIKFSDDHWQEHWAIIEATAQQKVTNIINSYDPLWRAWKQGNEDMRVEWATTWEKALDLDKLGDNWTAGNNSIHDAKLRLDEATTAYEKLRAKGTATAEELVAANGKVVEAERNVEEAANHMLHSVTDPLVKAFEQPFLDIERMFIKMLSGMIADWESQLLGPMLQSTRAWMGGMFGISTSTGGWGGQGGQGGGYGGVYPGTPPFVNPTHGYSPFGGYNLGHPSAMPTNSSWVSTPGAGYYYGGELGLDSTGYSGFMGLPTGGTGMSEQPKGSWLQGTGGKAVLGVAGGAMMGLQADTSHGFNNAMLSGLGMDSASGVATTVMMGIATMGISVGVQAAVAALKYAFRDRTPEDIVKTAKEEFGGQEWSEALVKSISDTAKTRHTGIQGGKDEQAATLLELPAIVAEHPIDSSNIDMYMGKVHDLFSMVEIGHMSIAEATTTLDAVFPKLSAAATDSYGRINNGLREIISLNDRFGTQSKAIAEWKKGQSSDIVGGVTAEIGALPITEWDKIQGNIDTAVKAVPAGTADDLLAELQAMQKTGYTDEQLQVFREKLTARQVSALAGGDKKGAEALGGLNVALTQQAEARPIAKTDIADLSIQAVGAYEVARGTGKSEIEAVKEESKGLTDLQKAYKDLGIDVEDTGLRHLFILNTVITKQPALLAGVDGLSKAVVGYDNLGKETKELFESQERSGLSMWERVKKATIDAGGTSEDALGLMQGWLHVAADEAEKLGVKLDDGTQALIDQSKEAGVWQEKVKPKPDLTQTMDHLADTIEDLDRALRGLPPKVRVDVDVNTTHHDDGKGDPATTPPIPGKGPPETPPGAPEPPTPRPLPDRALSFGRGSVIPESAGTPGIDSILAWVAPGEAILPLETVRALGPNKVQGLIDAKGYSDGGIVPGGDVGTRVAGSGDTRPGFDGDIGDDYINNWESGLAAIIAGFDTYYPPMSPILDKFPIVNPNNLDIAPEKDTFYQDLSDAIRGGRNPQSQVFINDTEIFTTQFKGTDPDFLAQQASLWDGYGAGNLAVLNVDFDDQGNYTNRLDLFAGQQFRWWMSNHTRDQFKLLEESAEGSLASLHNEYFQDVFNRADYLTALQDGFQGPFMTFMVPKVAKDGRLPGGDERAVSSGIPVIPMAAGGFGTVTTPTLFLAGEAGPEHYVFQSANSIDGLSGSIGLPPISPIPPRLPSPIPPMPVPVPPRLPPPTFPVPVPSPVPEPHPPIPAPVPTPIPKPGPTLPSPRPVPTVPTPGGDGRVPRLPISRYSPYTALGSDTEPATVRTTTVHMEIHPTIHLHSDDAKDPERVLTILADGLRDNNLFIRTKVEHIAVAAVENAT